MPLPGTNPQYPAEPLSNELQTTETRSRRSRMGFVAIPHEWPFRRPSPVASSTKVARYDCANIAPVVSATPKRKGAT